MTDTKNTKDTEPTKAYNNLDFLNSKDARTLRILSEYVYPKKQFEEEKIKNTENLLGTIALDVAKINESMQRTEKKMKDLSRRACSNAILCERKK